MKRWVCSEMPVLACVDGDYHEEREHVTNVVASTDEIDLAPIIRNLTTPYHLGILVGDLVET